LYPGLFKTVIAENKRVFDKGGYTETLQTVHRRLESGFGFKPDPSIKFVSLSGENRNCFYGDCVSSDALSYLKLGAKARVIVATFSLFYVIKGASHNIEKFRSDRDMSLDHKEDLITSEFKALLNTLLDALSCYMNDGLLPGGALVLDPATYVCLKDILMYKMPEQPFSAFLRCVGVKIEKVLSQKPDIPITDLGGSDGYWYHTGSAEAPYYLTVSLYYLIRQK